MTYKEQFIKFMADCGVLTFGDFTLKSGRKSPYFLNAGNYNTGAALAKLGEFYAECFAENKVQAETLFGPAYKGIPLAVATAVTLKNKFDIDINYCFDRKEEKDHGEGGWFVGKQPENGEKIAIIDDVSTSGKAIREVMPKLKKAADVNVTSFLITADRMEKTMNGEFSAVQEIGREFGIKVYSIINFKDIIAAVEKGVVSGAEYLPAMKAYIEKHGAKY
ncbi:MAG: orotate phosphoribosyltransferase [Oscillospiraceae bacterium]|jgi:orotate phosphoribosyltransferase|nr:orotate phosphoribosyltransferase [Oscillospiraceae bacterium]